MHDQAAVKGSRGTHIGDGSRLAPLKFNLIFFPVLWCSRLFARGGRRNDILAKGRPLINGPVCASWFIRRGWSSGANAARSFVNTLCTRTGAKNVVLIIAVAITVFVVSGSVG